MNTKNLKEIIQKTTISEVEKLSKQERKSLLSKHTKNFTEKDLNSIETSLHRFRNELENLKSIPQKIRTKTQNARIEKLNELIPSISVQLNVDRANLKNKKHGIKMIKIGNSKVKMFY